MYCRNPEHLGYYVHHRIFLGVSSPNLCHRVHLNTDHDHDPRDSTKPTWSDPEEILSGGEVTLMKKFHVISILLGTVLLIFLIWKIGIDALRRDICLLGWGVVFFILMKGIVDIFHTIGWRYCLSQPHRSFSFFRLLSINLAGNSINYVTPTADIGGEVIKGTFLSLNHRGPEAATGVIIGKLSYALSQFLFVILGSILILWKIHLPAAGSAAMLMGSTLIGAGIIGFLIVQKHGKLGVVVRWLVSHNVGGEILQKTAHHITQVDSALKLFYKDRPADLPISIFWHMVGMACSIMQTWYFLALLADGSFFAAAGIWFLGTWFDLLTFAIPLGIGIQEGTRLIAFKALGFSLTLGLTYGILLRLEQIFWAGIGFFMYAILLAEKREGELLPNKEVKSDNPSLD